MNRKFLVGLTACVMALLALAIWEADRSSSESRSINSMVALHPDHLSGSIQKVGHPMFASPHSSPIAISGRRVFVVNTPSDTVDVIDAQTREIISRVPVGIDPVSIAIRPDGKEVWVSNHISDSVSVIANVPGIATDLQVIATIQEFDAKKRSTRFDEPVGIAFAGNHKAYVALSSNNAIAVVDVSSRKVTRRLRIPAQDPRSIIVRNERLYVIPFESNNKTQLSGGAANDIDGDLVTFDAWQHSIVHNNVLSLGHVVDIVKHPDVPDRDLFVFDTETDKLVEVVDTLGTLLYGMTVDSKGSVFIAQTDARNDANGRAGTKKHGLAELENRAFLNQITRIDMNGDSAETPEFYNLEPLPPQQPAQGEALATPFAVQISNDDKTLVATAAGSDKLFTVDAGSGKVLGRVAVGAVPRGIALDHAEDGKVATAWVYNAVANTVSVLDMSDLSKPRVTDFVPLVDPTDRQVKLGRTWFNAASASTTGTYSCASCHPDGHTDQLLWVLKTPVVTGGNQIMPRSTMPIRGLRDTAPFHWDGIPGDPYGGNNSGNIYGSDPANSDPDQPESTTRNVIDGGLAATMLMHGADNINDEGKTGAFSAAERDDMAKFLLAVPFPPSQRRAYTNVVSERAKTGFELFHIKGHHDEKPKPNVCGDCHRMPFMVSTNTPGTGMDAPTWRGAYDRFLILPQGRLNIIEFDFYRRMAERGVPEREIWQTSWQAQPRFDPIWDMVLEGSTGFSGSFARQLTLSQATVHQKLTADLLHALETAADEGAVILEAEGVLVDNNSSQPIALQYVGGHYVGKAEDERNFSLEELHKLAANGKLIATFTARHGSKAEAVANPQPALWTLSPLEKQSGHQEFPILHPTSTTMLINGRHIDEDATVIVNGRRVAGNVFLDQGEQINVQLESLPAPGIHLLQVQTPSGLFSNDFIFHVVDSQAAAEELRTNQQRTNRDIRNAIAEAIADDDLAGLRRHLSRRRQRGRVNEQQPSSGTTPLSNAALHGNAAIADFLIQRGANVNEKNRDGNTPLHVAAFLCRAEIVKQLIEKGGSTAAKNRSGETPLDVVASPWSDELARTYRYIGDAVGLELNLDEIQEQRPIIARLLGGKRDESEIAP
ncbi:MAG: ankyrin repeat domain-containing protein [Rubripirellula sp.]|nr:ankyrin repeat domain-containing protein [Rubripirellula sp.]